MLAPAMNGKMYEHEAVQSNLKTLKGRELRSSNRWWGNSPVATKVSKLAPISEITAKVFCPINLGFTASGCIEPELSVADRADHACGSRSNVNTIIISSTRAFPIV